MKKNDIGCLSMGAAIILGVILLITLSSFITGTIIWALWNWVAVILFEYQPISYWFGVGIGLIFNVIVSLEIATAKKIKRGN